MHTDQRSSFKIITQGPILIAYLSMLVLGVADNVRGPLFVDILKSFSLDHSRGSLFFSLGSAMVLPGGYLAGYLLKKVSLTRAMQISVLLMTSSLIGFAISRSFEVLLIFVPFFGLALAMQGVVQNVTVLKLAPHERMQKLQSGLHSMYGLASLVAPLLVILIMHYRSDWQSVFAVASVLGIVILLFSFSGKNGHPDPKESQVSGRKVANPQSLDPVGGERFLGKKAAWYFGTMMAIYVTVENLLFTHISQFARESAHFDLQTANTLTTLFFAAVFFGRILFSFWQPERPLIQQMSLCLIGAIFTILGGAWISPWIFILAGLCVAPFYPMGMTAAGHYFKGEVGTVASHTVGLSGITVVIMQTLVGFISDLASLPWAMMVGCVFAVLTLAMLVGFEPWAQINKPLNTKVQA
jgi:fucose permease